MLLILRVFLRQMPPCCRHAPLPTPHAAAMLPCAAVAMMIVISLISRVAAPPVRTPLFHAATLAAAAAAPATLLLRFERHAA